MHISYNKKKQEAIHYFKYNHLSEATFVDLVFAMKQHTMLLDSANIGCTITVIKRVKAKKSGKINNSI